MCLRSWTSSASAWSAGDRKSFGVIMIGSFGVDVRGVGDGAAQRSQGGTPCDELIQRPVQGIGVVLTRYESGVVLEIGEQRDRDLMAHIGHAQRAADRTQLYDSA